MTAAITTEGQPTQDQIDATIAELEVLLKQVPTETADGAVPWPMVLVEGEEKSGKSWDAAELTASDKVGRCFWLEFGFEGTARQYGGIKGAKYEIVPFTGLREFMARLQWLKQVAILSRKAREKPMAIVVDTMSAEWKALGKLAEWRARRSKSSQGILARDPNAEITVGPNYWNPVTDKHYEILNLLASIPAIVVLTARGGEVTAFNSEGKPVAGEKAWSVKGHKELGFDVTAWVRKHRAKDGRRGRTEVVSVRSVHAGVTYGEDEPIVAPRNNMLEWLIFEVMQCDPDKAYCRTISRDGADDDRAEEQRRQAERQADREMAQQRSQEAAAAQEATEGSQEEPAQEPEREPVEPVEPVEVPAQRPAAVQEVAQAQQAEEPARPRKAVRPLPERIIGGFDFLEVRPEDRPILAADLLNRATVDSINSLSKVEQAKLFHELGNLAQLPDKGAALITEIVGKARENAGASA